MKIYLICVALIDQLALHDPISPQHCDNNEEQSNRGSDLNVVSLVVLEIRGAINLKSQSIHDEIIIDDNHQT